MKKKNDVQFVIYLDTNQVGNSICVFASIVFIYYMLSEKFNFTENKSMFINILEEATKRFKNYKYHEETKQLSSSYRTDNYLTFVAPSDFKFSAVDGVSDDIKNLHEGLCYDESLYNKYRGEEDIMTGILNPKTMDEFKNCMAFKDDEFHAAYCVIGANAFSIVKKDKLFYVYDSHKQYRLNDSDNLGSYFAAQEKLERALQPLVQDLGALYNTAIQNGNDTGIEVVLLKLSNQD
jgi:hypothetical protein